MIYSLITGSAKRTWTVDLLITNQLIIYGIIDFTKQ